MKFSIDFFQDEERCGFYIPTAIKQAWAVGLTILSEIDRICKKYNITYYAEWGTLLGAIRHGGFVPWDDDLDISMKREDYIRFREIADKELPEGFAIHDYERKEDHWLFLSRVVNSNSICFDKKHLDQYFNFPYIATVDIFVLDYLYRDEQEEKKRCQEVKNILVTADRIVRDGYIDEPGEIRLQKLEREYHISVNRSLSPREIAIALYRLAEQQMARVKEQDADCVGQIFPWILKGGKGLPKKYFEKAIDVPFENGTIKVPVAYDSILSARYGDYFTFKKIWNGHDYPYFEGQRANLQAVADFKLPEFTFKKEMLDVVKEAESWKVTVHECLDAMQQLQNQLELLINEKNFEAVFSLLPECQQLAVDLGSYIEMIKGEQHPFVERVVAKLSKYCDSLYQLYELILNRKEVEDAKDCQRIFSEIIQEIKKLLLRREVVFLLTDSRYFNVFQSLYAKEKKDKNVDVYVVLVPVMYKDVFGKIQDVFCEEKERIAQDFLIEESDIYDSKDINLELHHPGIIYFQNPYDGENPCLTVPSGYYAEKLRKITEKLIFVQNIWCDEFVEENTSDWYNMKHYVTVPGIIYADQVMVSSEHVKKQWIKRLTLFAGLNTQEIWKDKIVIYPFSQKKGIHEQRKKVLLYCIGESEFADCESLALSMIDERLMIMSKYNEQLELRVCLYPNIVKKRKEVISLLKKHNIAYWFVYGENKNDNTGLCDADIYYGTASPLVVSFMRENKPVLISKK